MNDKNFCIISFESTHDVIATKKILEETIAIEMIPTPREISASCGLSLKFSPNDYEELLKCLVENVKLDTDKKIYCFQYNDGGNNFKLKKMN